MSEPKLLQIYTDGASFGNPGPGGYGVVLLYGKTSKELSRGFRKTTNNRMELMAAIAGLEALKQRCRVQLLSDSTYVVKSVEEGRVEKWRMNGWRRGRNMAVANRDLWERLLSLLDLHDVTFQWIKGHSGDPYNERCDELAVAAAGGDELDVDVGYEGA